MSAARTLPVTPAERFLAAMLRAWQAWPGIAREPDRHTTAALVAVDMHNRLYEARLISPGDLTPAGRDLLARVEATRSAEHIARELVIKLQTSGAPGVLVSEAQSVLVNVRARAARLAAAPPAKEPA